MLATLVFGMPPVIRLTALGIRGVPESTKEAATAFGCTRWTRCSRTSRFPLAMPSIMTGVNQTILMCLSMVVIASLIGAKGLGQDVLVALQYAAKGQGMLAGPRHPVLRDGHRPHRAGALQALDRAPPARTVARPEAILESRPRPG